MSKPHDDGKHFEEQNFEDQKFSIDGSEDIGAQNDATEKWTLLEQMIYDARNYVEPGEQLRPKLLEAAREVCDDRRHDVRLSNILAMILLIVALASPVVRHLELWNQSQSIDSHEVEQRAMQLAGDTRIGRYWSLSEAFRELRGDQAARLGQTIR